MKPSIVRTTFASILFLATMAAHAQGKWATPTDPSGTRYLSYTAKASLLGKPVEFALTFSCNTTHTKTESGTLGFDLYLADIALLKAFHFEDFEGPDAPSAEKRLMKVTIARNGKSPLTFDFSPNGAYPLESNFVFGVADETHLAKSDSKTILQALAEGAESMQLVITDFRDPKLKLDLTVPVAGKQAAFRELLTGVTPAAAVDPTATIR